ncbi:DNA-directed RNA polymerase family protein [Salix suchowensis]|nr:DNA-directed RNA polymerase family protein [Salix suchowensis]KAG5253225.1 DNA-directed RNA polymerase family protein [Salix suchowensis]
MLLSTVDSRGSLIHLVRLLLSLDTIHPSRKMVNGDVHQLDLESDAEHNMFFRHVRLQNMTYSARMKIHVNVQVYTQTVGVEKVFIAQEQICMNRLWISNSQDWTVSYNFEVKRNKLIVRLVELTKLEYIRGEKKGLCVYFLSIEIPIWILFLPLV